MAIIKQLKGTADSCALIIKKMESKLDIYTVCVIIKLRKVNFPYPERVWKYIWKTD